MILYEQKHEEDGFSVLLATFRGINWSPMDSPNKEPVMRILDVSYAVIQSKPLNKLSSCRWFESQHEANVTSLQWV